MKPYLIAPLLGIFALSASHADDAKVQAQQESQILLIIAPSSPREMDCFQDAMNAHLSDFGATAVVKRMADMPSDDETQRDVARALLLENSNTLAAVWMDSHPNRLLMLIRDQDTEQLQERPLDAGMQNDERRCDAAAAMVRSVLTPWLTGEETAASLSSSLPKAQRNEKPKAQETAVRSRSRSRHWQAQLGAAYTLVADLRGTVLNGGALGAGLRFPGLITVGLGACLRILQPSEMHIQDQDISLFRLPLTLKLEAVFQSGKFGLGLAAGWTFDIARVLGVNEAEAPEPIHRMRMGFSPSGTLQYLAAPWISVDLSVGVDIFFEPYHYRWNGETVFTNQTVQLFSLLGISFFLPTATKENRR